MISSRPRGRLGIAGVVWVGDSGGRVVVELAGRMNGLLVVSCKRDGATPVMGTTRTVSRTVNVEPLPSALSTLMSPPINRANCREMARPSPVPPYLADVE